MAQRTMRRAVLGAVLVLGALGVGGAVLTSLLAGGDPATGDGGPRGVEAELVIERAHQGAAALVGKGDYAEAEAVARAALDTWADEQRLHLVLGEALIGQRRWEEAYAAMDEAVRLGPDSAEYRFLMGTIAFEAGELALSEHQYTLAQQQAPGNPKHPLYRAQVQRALGDVEGARRSLGLVTALDETIPQAWAGLAGLALDSGNAGAALEYIRRARALEPAGPAYRLIESKALRREGRPREAAEVLIGAPMPNAASAREVLAELGLSLGLLGEAGEAARAYAEASVRWPDDAALAYQSAVWHERAGDVEAALGAARRAVILGHEGARDLAARLVADR
ncbi:MAG: tetratricopeptide repeat protein [Planctomycetota bacterium]